MVGIKIGYYRDIEPFGLRRERSPRSAHGGSPYNIPALYLRHECTELYGGFDKALQIVESIVKNAKKVGNSKVKFIVNALAS